jgi:hypothetical protein
MSLIHLKSSASTPTKDKVASVLRIVEEKSHVLTDLPDISTQTVPNAISALKNYRAAIPDKSPLLSALDSILLPLMALDYHNPAEAGPYDVVHSMIADTSSDCLLSDLKESLLFTEVSDLLEIVYLSIYDGVFDIKKGYAGHGICGTVYGPHSRPIVCLPVRIGKNTQLNVHFLVDTGAPRSEIPGYVFDKLKPSAENLPSVFNGIIANQSIQLGICSPTGNHFDIPLLGQDFLKLIKATLIVDYDTNSTKIVVK